MRTIENKEQPIFTPSEGEELLGYIHRLRQQLTVYDEFLTMHVTKLYCHYGKGSFCPVCDFYNINCYCLDAMEQFIKSLKEKYKIKGICERPKGATSAIMNEFIAKK